MTDITLTIGSQIFSGWTAMTVSRALDKMASHFRLSVTTPTPANPFGAVKLVPFTACTVKIQGTPVLTGFVDSVDTEIDDRRHTITVGGRSATCDLIDCSPDIKSGQFRGYTLEQIARAMCALFNIGVVIQTNASQIFPDATLQRSETAYVFLERLSRLSGVLLTDNELGELVLSTAASARAAGRLVFGVNVLRAASKLSGEHRFSQYIVKGQTALGSTHPGWNPAGGIIDPTPTPAPVNTSQQAVAIDGSVPRFRPHVSMAEAQLDQAGMTRRARWERNFAIGRGTEAEVTVKGWRQGGLADASGKTPLWQLNQLVSATLLPLGIDQDLLVAGVDFRIDDKDGQTTRLKIGPVEGYTPDPGQVKLKARRGLKGKTTPNWDALNALIETPVF